MIVLSAPGQTLRRALRGGLVDQGEHVWSVLSGSSLELMLAACGCSAIVYVAGASMLEGQLTPQPLEERARQVLQASAMPGVNLLVAVVPSGDNYESEEGVLRTGDVPSVILRCAPLIEEVEASADGLRWLRQGSRVTTGAMLSSTVVRALRDASWSGRTVEVPTLYMDPTRSRARVASRVSLPRLAPLPAFACAA